MATYEDLSPYSYSEWFEPMDKPMLNVGWLGDRIPFRAPSFTTGPVDQAIIDELVLMANHQSNVMRGWHNCELCDEESPIIVPAPVGRGEVYLGHGELHVRDPSDTVIYSAPALVVHYITAHHYRPPQQFLDAVAWVTQKRRDGHPSREPLRPCEAVDRVASQLTGTAHERWESHLADLTGHEQCIVDALTVAASAQDWLSFDRYLTLAGRFHCHALTPVLGAALDRRGDQARNSRVVSLLRELGDPAASAALEDVLSWGPDGDART